MRKRDLATKLRLILQKEAPMRIFTVVPQATTTATKTMGVLYWANGATSVPISGITFTWPAVSGSNVTYQFALAQASANTSANEFAILDYSDNTTTNAEPAQETLQYNTVYWWEVRAVTMNSSGAAYSHWSVVYPDVYYQNCQIIE